MGLDSRNEFSNRTIRLCLIRVIISIRGEIKCSDIMTFRHALYKFQTRQFGNKLFHSLSLEGVLL
jgi:hypothetical protein